MQRTAPRVLGVVALGLLVTSLVGCSSDSDSDPVADPGSASSPASTAGAPASPSPSSAVPTTTAPSSQAPTSEAPTGTPTSAAPASPSSVAASSSSPPTTAPPTKKANGGTLRSVRNDVASIAPQLESYYRDREYPVDLAQVRQTLAESGVTLSSGNSVAGYTYDGDAVEFVLCVENTSGAWATYDTAPMTLSRSGGKGGCAAS